jgi:hypothetical protein
VAWLRHPCLWRDDLRLPLLPLVERGPGDAANTALDTHLPGTINLDGHHHDSG